MRSGWRIRPPAFSFLRPSCVLDQVFDSSKLRIRVGKHPFEHAQLDSELVDRARGALTGDFNSGLGETGRFTLPGEINLGGPPLGPPPGLCREEPRFDHQIEVCARDVRVDLEVVRDLLDGLRAAAEQESQDRGPCGQGQDLGGPGSRIVPEVGHQPR
jgi:hypothetical protein